VGGSWGFNGSPCNRIVRRRRPKLMSVLSTFPTAMYGIHGIIGIPVAAVRRSMVELEGFWFGRTRVSCGPVRPSGIAAFSSRTSGTTCTAPLQTALVACETTDERRNDEETCTTSDQVSSHSGIFETALEMAVSCI
jgi:hypothetical protein